MTDEIPDDTELDEQDAKRLAEGAEVPSGYREPSFCVDCGSGRIVFEYDNSSDPGFSQWCIVACHDCGRRNKVTPR